jgi:hypothetical protein
VAEVVAVEPIVLGLLLVLVVLAVVAQEMHLVPGLLELLTQEAVEVGEASQQLELAPAPEALALSSSRFQIPVQQTSQVV